MYNSRSPHAEDFINHQEILDILESAENMSRDKAMMNAILSRASDCKGLSPVEACALLVCDDRDITHAAYALAEQIKNKIYGRRIVMFAPLYLSNHCVNECTYCPYHHSNSTICRKKLSQDDILREVIALQDMGHKRLALETGEDPVNSPIEYVLESIKTIYGIHIKTALSAAST